MLKTNRGKFYAASIVGVLICVALFAFGQWSAALILLILVGWLAYTGYRSET